MEKKRLVLLLAILLSLCFSSLTLATTIVLKSGETIEAKVTDMTEDYITVEIEGGHASYGVSEIESINGLVCDKEGIKRVLSKRTGKRQIVAIPPEKFRRIKDPSGKYAYAYATGDRADQALTMVFREIYVPNQTALQWAEDEAKSIENVKLGSAVKLFEVTSQRSIRLDNFNWFVIETTMSSSDNRVFKGQQYYAKINDDYIIEVMVTGPPKLFESAVDKEIIEYLSSFRVKSPSMEETLQLAYHKDRINKNLANFTIASPEYVEQINYMRGDLPLTITAPKGWYMALKKEHVEGVDRVFFCKYDPEKPFLQDTPDPFETPYIKVGFLPNPKGLPPIIWHNRKISRLKSTGATILTDEEITIDNRLGSHLTASMPGKNSLVDVYTFTIEDVFLSIKAICRSDEFEETKKKIKEAIDSIRFSSYFQKPVED